MSIEESDKSDSESESVSNDKTSNDTGSLNLSLIESKHDGSSDSVSKGSSINDHKLSGANSGAIDLDSNLNGLSVIGQNKGKIMPRMPYASLGGRPVKAVTKPSDQNLGMEEVRPVMRQMTRRNPRVIESTNVNLGGSGGGAFDTAFKRQVNDEMEEMRNKMSK